MNNTIRTVVITIVTIVWALNFTAPIFVADYEPSPELNVAFMAIIGVLTASYKLDNNKDQKKKSSDSDSDSDSESAEPEPDKDPS